MHKCVILLDFITVDVAIDASGLLQFCPNLFWDTCPVSTLCNSYTVQLAYFSPSIVLQPF